MLVVAMTAAGCGGDGERERAACDPGRPRHPGVSTIELRSGGVDRRALLFVPGSYDGTAEFPVVLSWHGYSATAAAQLRYADLRDLAESEGFLIALPEGEGAPTRFNLGRGIVGETDDVGFALDLLDHLGEQLCVDDSRVYSTGASNGAGMSALLACREPDRIAAIAMVALTMMFDGCGSPAPAALGMMGDADLVVPIQGGRVNCCDGWEIAPFTTTMRRWAEHAGCTEREEERVADHVERTTWTSCDGDVEVRAYLVDDGGHTWPGADERSQLGPTNREIDASEIIWEFFSRFTRE